MKNVLILLIMMTTLHYGSFMDGVESVVKRTLSHKKHHRLPKLETVGTVKDGGNKEKKSFINTLVKKVKKKVRKTIGIEQKSVIQEESLLDDIVIKAKDSVGLGKPENSLFSKVLTTVGVKEKKKPKKDDTILTTMVKKMKHTIGLKEEKKSSSLSLDTMISTMTNTMGISNGDTSILGELKHSSTGVFQGFKNSGESAEFVSGVVYKSTKIYNQMFGMFSDSPFNLFEEKKKSEPSLFDMFGKGNDMLKLWD